MSTSSSNVAPGTVATTVADDAPDRPRPLWSMRKAVHVAMIVNSWAKSEQQRRTSTPTTAMVNPLARLQPAVVSPIVPVTVDKWSAVVRTLSHFWIDDSLRAYYLWTLLVSIACLYNVFVIVARMTFDGFADHWKVWLVLDYVGDAVYVLDMIVESRKGFLHDGLMVTNSRAMLVNYTRSTLFWLDVLSVIPFDILYYIWPGAVFVRLNRLTRFHRVLDLTERTETRTPFPNTFRILKLVFTIFIVFHWNACIFFAMSKSYDMEAAGKRQWQFQYGKIHSPLFSTCPSCSYVNNTKLNDTENAYLMRRYWLNHTSEYEVSNLTKQYLFSVYWSALILTNLGEQVWPLDLNQFVFVIIDILFGLLIFATIVGQVGEMVTNMNQAKTDFESHQDGVKMFMEFRNVDAELRQKIIHWFRYIWAQGQSLNENAITAALPPKLKAELAIATHLNTLKRVKLFQDCEPGLLVELVLKLQLQVFSPGDYICRKGDVGKEMYIVKTGSLEVVSPDGKIVFVTLNEGAVFGELSILDIAGNKNGNKRTAGVRSVGYSDLFILSKDDLWDALREYPDAKRMLLDKGRAILIKDKLMVDGDDSSSLITSGPVKTTEQKLQHVEDMVRVLNADLDKLISNFATDTAKHKQNLTQMEQTYWEHREKLKNKVKLQ